MPPSRTITELVAQTLNGHAPAAALEWPDPIPLGEASGPAPEFPVDCLPAWMQQYVIDVAVELQAPVDLPAALGLVALSMCYAGRWRVHIRNAWSEPVNLYVVVALPPSTGKSPAFKAMLGPLEQWEIAEAERLAAPIETNQQKRRMIEKAMKRAEEKGDSTEARMQLEDLLATPELVAPRIRADDATPEALVDLMARHGGAIALTSTEGGPFDLMGGRYSEKSNLDVYLKAWSCDVIRIDRIGRGTSVVKAPTLTIGLTVQPDVLRGLAAHPEFAGRGLTARFMYSLPDSLVGRRNLRDAPAGDPATAANYQQRLVDTFAAARDTDGCLTMDVDAAEMFVTWRQQLEHRRGPHDDLAPLSEWSTKLESSVARTAALLALADRRPTVDAATMSRALRIGAYWLEHAKAVFDLWGADPVTVAALKILQWAAARRVDEFSVRDVYHALRRSVLPTVDEARAPLDLLVERGWLRPLFDGPLVLGRRGMPSPRFAVHPSNLWISGPHGDHGDHGPKNIFQITSSSSLEKGVEACTPSHDPHGPHEVDLEEAATTRTHDPHDVDPPLDGDPFSIF